MLPNRLACTTGEYQSAHRDYSDALEMAPSSADAAFGRGEACLKLGRVESAIADYSSALAADPNHTKALYNRAAALNMVERFDEAVGTPSLMLVVCLDVVNGAAFAPCNAVLSSELAPPSHHPYHHSQRTSMLRWPRTGSRRQLATRARARATTPPASSPAPAVACTARPPARSPRCRDWVRCGTRPCWK